MAVNVADRSTPPKVEQKDVNYFQPEQVAAIREALEEEPIKWRTLVHLLLITGCRRGEVLGLKWDKVDFTSNQAYICNNILYSADVGIYEDTPKTERSKRYVSLPTETIQLLRQYRAWQRCGAAPLGGILPGPGVCIRTGQWRPHAPGQRNHLAFPVQQAPRPPARQCSCIPPHDGLYAVLQRSGQCFYIKAAGARPSEHNGKYLRSRHRGSRQKERRHSGRRFPEKSMNFESELNKS